MAPNEFKIKYPQYSHLEGDKLWDKMTLVLLQNSDNVLTADPNREIIYKKYNINGFEINMEDESKTIWLTKEGYKCMQVPEIKKPFEPATESYRFDIIDLSKS